MRTESPFSSPRGPDWPNATRVWNQGVDGKTLFYKLPEHLKSYYETWKSNMNAKHTAMATEDERNQIDTVIHHESRLAHVPPLPELPLPLPPIK